MQRITSTADRLSTGGPVEASAVRLTLPAATGAHYRIENPLGTEFDLADVSWGAVELECSTFLDTWSTTEIERHRTVEGLWLASSPTDVHLLIGPGRAEHLGQHIDGVVDEVGRSLFYRLPDTLDRAAPVDLVLNLVSMG